MVSTRQDVGLEQRGKDMPKPAITLLGLMLAAVSIGWNTWRYPVVWQMVDSRTPSVSAGESAPAATEPSAKSTEPSAKPTEPSEKSASKAKAALPAAIASATPLPDVPKKIIPDRAAATLEVSPASAVGERQLRPISAIPSSGGDAAAVLQRLPPVDPNEPPPSFDLRTADGGTIVYPSTGH